MSTSTEDRALKLLALNVPQTQVAAILGVDPSRISQLLADASFSARLAEEKFRTLTDQANRDVTYDRLEDKVLERLESTIPLMHRPLELLRAAQILNAAKRRGTVEPGQDASAREIIQLVLPVSISQKFLVQFNSTNQVVAVDDRELVTIQSGKLQELLNESTPQTLPTRDTKTLIGAK